MGVGKDMTLQKQAYPKRKRENNNEKEREGKKAEETCLLCRLHPHQLSGGRCDLAV
jgi:hypothetical protein